MVSILNMENGKQGKIAAINGGTGLLRKLESMGVQVGTEISKISNQWLKGPVVIRARNTEIAIGYNMAKKIMVEL